MADRGEVLRAEKLGWMTLADLYPEDNFLSPPDKADASTTYFSDLLLNYRIRATCRRLHDSFPAPPPTLNVFEQTLSNSSQHKLTTRLYNTMQADFPIAKHKSVVGWNEELPTPLTEEQWKFCCGKLELFSPNYRLRLIHFKFLHRYYRTPAQLLRMGLREDAGDVIHHKPLFYIWPGTVLT